MFSTAACGGSDDARMRATLTHDGCTYEGDTKVEAGRFQIDVKNQTQHDASFLFGRLANGYTAATIKPILAKEVAWGRSLTKSELRGLLEGKLPLQHPRPDLPQIFDFRQGGSDTFLGVGGSSVLRGQRSARLGQNCLAPRPAKGVRCGLLALPARTPAEGPISPDASWRARRRSRGEQDSTRRASVSCLGPGRRFRTSTTPSRQAREQPDPASTVSLDLELAWWLVRTLASPLHAQGRSWAEIGRLVGQRKLSVTADTYTHVMSDGGEVPIQRLLGAPG